MAATPAPERNHSDLAISAERQHFAQLDINSPFAACAERYWCTYCGHEVVRGDDMSTGQWVRHFPWCGSCPKGYDTFPLWPPKLPKIYRYWDGIPFYPCANDDCGQARSNDKDYLCDQCRAKV